MNSRERLATICNWVMAAAGIGISAVVFVQLFSVPPQSTRVQLAVKPFVPPAPVAAMQVAPAASSAMRPQTAAGVSAPQAQAASAPAPQAQQFAGSTGAVAQPGMQRGPQTSNNPWGQPVARTPAVPIPNINPHLLPPGYNDF